MLFHEIYGTYYHTTSIILREAVRDNLTGKKLNELIRKEAFEESIFAIPEGLEGEEWQLIHSDYSTPLEEEPAMPLTLLEKRWMKAVMQDPRIRLFDPDASGLEEIEPLFTPEMVTYYDRYADGDDYRDLEYIRRFRIILQAIQEKNNLLISFKSKNHSIRKLVVTPYYLEYSEKDDRFRLIAAGWKRRWTFNLSRIVDCETETRYEPMPLMDENMDTVTFELEDRRNALNRVLLHFSHLEKETKKLDEKHYRVTLKYDRQDETEMVIRILSFGPAIRVIEPEGFIELLRERIERQKQFATNLPGKEKRFCI